MTETMEHHPNLAQKPVKFAEKKKVARGRTKKGKVGQGRKRLYIEQDRER